MYAMDCNICKDEASVNSIECKRCHDRYHFSCVLLSPENGNHPNLYFFCNCCTRLVQILLANDGVTKKSQEFQSIK